MTAQTFRYVPTQAESCIYTKFTPEPKIQCHETAKNATYMNNVNTVDLTVEGYTGQVVVKAVCEQGGVFTSGAEQTVTVESGNRITLPENIVFVPTQTGEVSYAIEVYLSDGRKIGETTVTNTITATKLTPKIRVYYAEPKQQNAYSLDGGYTVDSTAVHWCSYTKIKADVTFTPTLDYAEPLAGKTLAKVKLKPFPTVMRIYSVYDMLDIGLMWAVGWMTVNSDGCPDLDEIEVLYAPDSAPKAYLLMDIDRIPDYSDEEHYPTLNSEQVFAPYTEGYNDLILPEDEDNFIWGCFENRICVYYNFSYPKLKAGEASISAFYNGLDFDTKAIDDIIINELNG